MEQRQLLLGYARKYSNNWDKIFEAIQNKEQLTEADIAAVNSFSGNYVTILDIEYPNRLKQKYKQPFVLYYEGDVSLLSKIDSGELISLHGPNLFNISQDKLVTISDDYKIDICGQLKIWFNNESVNPDRYGLLAAVCGKLALTKIYDAYNSFSWFLNISIKNALELGADIYVVPSVRRSYNNTLIKEGANLLDCLEDLIND